MTLWLMRLFGNEAGQCVVKTNYHARCYVVEKVKVGCCKHTHLVSSFHEELELVRPNFSVYQLASLSAILQGVSFLIVFFFKQVWEQERIIYLMILGFEYILMVVFGFITLVWYLNPIFFFLKRPLCLQISFLKFQVYL